MIPIDMHFALSAWGFALAGLGIGAAVARLWSGRRSVTVAPIPAPSPIFRRPAEFGPLRLDWDDMDRIRTAIVADQLGGGDPSPERAREWLYHWQDDVVALTGRGLAA